jgi:hypothetical protein
MLFTLLSVRRHQAVTRLPQIATKCGFAGRYAADLAESLKRGTSGRRLTTVTASALFNLAVYNRLV